MRAICLASSVWMSRRLLSLSFLLTSLFFIPVVMPVFWCVNCVVWAIMLTAARGLSLLFDSVSLPGVTGSGNSAIRCAQAFANKFM